MRRRSSVMRAMSRTGPRRGRLAVAITALVVSAVITPVLAVGHAAVLPANQLYPPLPTSRCDTVTTGTPCAGTVSAGVCHDPAPGAPNSWDAVDAVTQASSQPYSGDESSTTNWYASTLVVDPWTPCLRYRIAPGAQRLDRSDDGGTSWRVVLDDNATGSSGAAFSIADLTVPAPHMLVVADSGSGDGVVISRDAGATWHIANGASSSDTLGTGLAGQFVAHVAGDPASVLYAAVFTAADQHSSPIPPGSGVYISRDGGESWAPSSNSLPAPAVTTRSLSSSLLLVSVDPLDSKHAFFLDNNPVQLYETVDGGATWTQRTVPQETVLGSTAGQATQGSVSFPFIVAHSNPKRSPRLYAVAVNAPGVGGGHTSAINVSDDDGQTWQLVQVATSLIFAFGADPLDQDRAMYIAVPGDGPARGVRYMAIYTDNGFATQGLAVPTPVTVDACCIKHAIGTDRQHRFYLDVDTLGKQPGTYTRAWSRYNPALPNSLKEVHIGGLGGCSSCSTVNAPLVYTCKPTAGGSSAQSLAFDGRYLYYTNHNDDTADGRGTIHRVDPSTCAQTTIRVQFDRTAANAGPGFDPAHPGLDELTYDPNHRVLLAETVRKGDKTPPAVFAVSVANAGDATHDGAATATLRWITTCIREPWLPIADTPSRLFSYDQSDDSIWGCNQQVPGHLSAQTGAPLDHCIGGVFKPNDSSTGEPDDAWGMGAPGNLWVQWGGIWHDVDLNTCEGTHQFRPSPGPGGSSTSQQTSSPTSDAQLACDPVSFLHAVRGLPPTVAAPGVMMWSRDVDGTIDAFDLGLTAGGFCPLPTTLRLLSPASVDSTQKTPVCLSAALALRGRGDGVGSQVVSFDVDGNPLGSAPTNPANGIAALADSCLDPTTLAVGTHHLAAHFAGDPRTYLGSDVAADLLVVAPLAAGVPPPPPPKQVVQQQPVIPPLLVPEHVLAPQSPTEAVAPPQPVPQPPGQQLIQLQATVTQKEEQHQLAFAYNAADQEPGAETAPGTEPGQPPQDEKPSEYAMSALHDDIRGTVEPVLGLVAAAGTLALLAGLALRRSPQTGGAGQLANTVSAGRSRRQRPRHRRR